MPHDQLAAVFWLMRAKERSEAERDVLQGAANMAAQGAMEMLA